MRKGLRLYAPQKVQVLQEHPQVTCKRILSASEGGRKHGSMIGIVGKYNRVAILNQKSCGLPQSGRDPGTSTSADPGCDKNQQTIPVFLWEDISDNSGRHKSAAAGKSFRRMR